MTEQLDPTIRAIVRDVLLVEEKVDDIGVEVEEILGELEVLRRRAADEWRAFAELRAALIGLSNDMNHILVDLAELRETTIPRRRIDRLEQAVLALVSDPGNPISSAAKAREVLELYDTEGA